MLGRRRLGVLLLCIGLACSRKVAREPVTVTFLDIEWEGPDQLDGLAQDLKEFTRETGIQVKRLPAPSGSLDQLALWRELLQKGAAAPDVCGIDVIWPGMLDPYLIDLKPYFSANLASQPAVVAASYTVGDKLVAVPRHAYVGVLGYRTDLLKRYGYGEPPKTWTELERMAARIQAGERARGEKDFWGFVWQGGATEDLTCAGLEWQVGEGGGRIIEEDRTISVNNPQTILAWQRAASWVGTISPPGVVAHAKWDSQNVWRSGKAAFLRGWVSDFRVITVSEGSGVAGLDGVTSVPGGRMGRASALGGNGLAVTRTSAHRREGVELIRYLLKRDIERSRALENSDPPKEPELHELPVILKPYSQLAEATRHGGDVVARPSSVAGSKYEEVSRAYIRAAHSVLTGERQAYVAAAALEKELVKITGFPVGKPPDKPNWQHRD